MKRLYIVVEGQTEQEFVNEILRPYLNSYEIYDVTPVPVHTSRTGRGGLVNYEHLKNTIKPLLETKGENIVVTTFIDYFRIPSNMPHYDACMRFGHSNDKVKKLEQSIDENINDRRFFSYIQLHEFEALLFSNNNGFKEYFTEKQSKLTDVIVKEFNNPEDINTRPQYAPSKRILTIKENYNKPLEGNLIALEIGINEMLKRCTRFSIWVNRLIQECK